MTRQTIPEITAEAIVSCMEALSKKEGDIKYLSNYISRSVTYTRRAITMGEQLSLFIIKSDSISLSHYCQSVFNRVAGNYKIIFRDALFNYKPFILFVDYTLKEDNVDEAIRKTKIVFDMDSDEKIILKTIRNFCKYIDITELKKEYFQKLFASGDSKLNYINKITNTINSLFEAQIFITEKLGTNCFNYLTDAERKLLSNALIKIFDNPPNAIDDSAGAFESFLRRIGKDRGIGLETFNGIDEIGQSLGSKSNKIILLEHKNMCSFFGSFRNPAIHKVHKTILEHWKIYPDSATEIILLMLTCIRSIYQYVLEGEKLIL